MRRRVATRAARFGERDVPEEVLAASLAAPANALRALTPHVDFIARIRNDDDGGGPRLAAFETVDTSGDWAKIAREFGGAYGAVLDGGGDAAVFRGALPASRSAPPGESEGRRMKGSPSSAGARIAASKPSSSSSWIVS